MFVSRKQWEDLQSRLTALEQAVKENISVQELAEKIVQELQKKSRVPFNEPKGFHQLDPSEMPSIKI